jgi:ketosteroid isomerase-like protein
VLAMSQENLDLVRSTTAAWERGDYSNVEWAHPEIEYLIVDGPSPGTWTGLAGMAHGWRDFLRAWEHEFRCVVEEYRELDDERVLVLQHFGGRGKASGVEVTLMTRKGATLFHLRDGKVARLVVCFDRERAFADLGLSAQDVHADS